MKLKGFIICFFISIFISCIGPIALQHSLNKYCVPLGYTFDSQIDSLKGNQKVFVKIFDKLVLNDTTKVKEEGMLNVPLVIAGGYKYDFVVSLGKKSVKPTLAEFTYDSFRKESLRSATFQVIDKKSRSNYILEISLIDCQIATKYHKDAVRFEHFSRYNWLLKPVTGTLKIEFKLLKNDNVIFSNIYTSSKSAQQENLKFSSESEMNNKMMDSFAKTASLEIKDIIELAISDINKQIL